MAALPQSNALGRSHKVLAPIAALTDWILITIEGWRERFRLRRELNDLRFDCELDRTLADSLISPFDFPRLVKVHPGGRDGRRCARLMEGDHTEIDTLVPPTAGGLLGRMIVLAQLRE